MNAIEISRFAKRATRPCESKYSTACSALPGAGSISVAFAPGVTMPALLLGSEHGQQVFRGGRSSKSTEPAAGLELDLDADPAARAPALAAVDRMVVEGRAVEAEGLGEARVHTRIDLAPRPPKCAVERYGIESRERGEGRGRRAVEEVVPEIDAARASRGAGRR